MSPTPSPPTYTREQQIAALTKATVASLHPENQSKLQEDVNNLIQKLKDIRDGFSAAGIALDKVDKAKDLDGKPLNDTGKSFFDQWNALSKQFDGILSQSCEVAGNVAGQCMGFENGVLKFVANPQGLTTDDLIEVVKSFLKGLKEDEGKIKGFETQFTALATSVETFANMMSAWAMERVKKDRKELFHLQDELRKAQDAVDTLKAKIVLVGAGMGVTLALVIALWFFCPLFALAIGAVGFTAEVALIIDYEKQVKAEEAKIDELNRKIDELIKEMIVVEDAQWKMDAVEGTNIPKIVTALKSFSAIWHTAIGDVVSIQTYLENPEKFKDEKPIVLAVFIQEKSSLYKSFGNAMLSYAKLQTSNLIESGVNYEPRPVEERLQSLAELGRIHPLVNEVVQDILKKADIRVRV